MSDRFDDRLTEVAVLDGLANGIRATIRQATLAEDQLTSFAFREDGSARTRPATSSPRFYVTRTLAAAADPATIRLLELTRDGGVPIDQLVERADLGTEPGDRVALAERIASAAGCGLVGRELERDTVASTLLGSALLALVETLEARLGAGDPLRSGDPPVGAP